MIDTLTITFTQMGLTYTIDIPTEGNNLPYDLAQAFMEIIRKSGANEQIVMEQLKLELGE